MNLFFVKGVHEQGSRSAVHIGSPADLSNRRVRPPSLTASNEKGPFRGPTYTSKSDLNYGRCFATNGASMLVPARIAALSR